MNEKQRRLLQYIQRFIDENHVAPSLHEMGLELGQTTGAALYHMRALERLGYVRRPKGKTRLIKILRQPDAAAA